MRGTVPIHVAYLTKDIEEKRPPPSSYMCIMKDCTGVENFVFCDEGNFNFVSARPRRDFHTGETRTGGSYLAKATKRDGRLLIKNTKEKGPMFKMREPRKYIYRYTCIYETKE